MTEFQEIMAQLDAAITGHSMEQVARIAHQFPESVTAWISQDTCNPTLYLSDGGYSRVVFSLERGRLFLTSNSRQQAKERWSKASAEIATVERFIRREIERFHGPMEFWEAFKASKLVSFLLEEEGCIAVDLDGTLAKDDGWQGPQYIGEPIPKMLKRVKDWLADGEEVVIFTARAHDGKKSTIEAIHKWLKKHGLPKLEVTNEKRPDMKEFWDDKAVEV